MSQVSYKITQICCVGFPQISVPQLAAVRESSMESSQIRRRIIAGYSQNLRMYPRNVLQKGCAERFKEIAEVLRTPKDDFAGLIVVDF